MPHCPNCNYDLTGLDLPHRCPECGYLADPPAEREAAVAWYASWKGLFFRAPPRMALAYLGDRRCRRRARQRGLLLLLVPWAAATLLILLGTSIQVVQTHETWWEKPESPGKKLTYREWTETSRLLVFDLEIGPLFDFDFVWGATRHDNTRTSVRLAWPAPDWLTLLVFIIPPAIGLLGVVFLAGGLRIHVAVTHRTIEAGGLWPLATLLAPWYAASVSCCLAATAGGLAMDIFSDNSIILRDILAGFFLAGLGVYCFGGVYVLFRGVRSARPYAHGLLTWLGLILLNLGWLAAVFGTWVLAAVMVFEAFD
jgi:hypothetical protein